METYEYSVSDDPNEKYTIQASCILRTSMAENAAKDFYSNHDGWDTSWPRTFKLWENGEYLGEFEVSIEAEPIFYAEKLGEES